MIMPGIVHNKGGTVVGRVENRVFIKELHGDKHMLRRPMAWAIDADIFDRVIKPNCFSIHIIDRDSKVTWIVGVNTFLNNRCVLERGYGKQYYLELVHWIAQ